MILMLFPPQWTPAAPAIGIPILKAHLEANLYKVDVKDLNIDFFNSILTVDYLSGAYNKVKSEFNQLEKKANKINKNDKINLSLSERSLLAKYEMYCNLFKENSDEINDIINNVEKYKLIYKDKEKFYNIREFLRAQKKIENALKIAQLPFSPTIYFFDYFYSPMLEYNFENIKFHCLTKNYNIFLDYFPEIIKKMIKPEHKLISVSVNSSSQLIPGLTLSYLIKRKYKDLHVNIGGDYFTRIADNIKKYQELFDLFVDSISIGDYEKSIIDLADYAVCRKKLISQVPGLMYKNKKNIIIHNKNEDPIDMNKVANINLNGYELDKYFSPEIVLPLKMSRHCSWNKCIFCDLYYGKKYSEKNPEIVVENIKEINKKYNITYFEFMDSSISPQYYSELSDIILREKLNINFYSFARLEKEFTRELLKKMNKAGLKMLVWGYESASKRIIKLMNKKTDFEYRDEILENAYKENIFNLIFTMLGFPTETLEESKLTMDVLASKTDILNPLPPTICVVSGHSKLLKFMQKNNIKFDIEKNKDFDKDFGYACGENFEELLKLRKEGLKKYRKMYKNGFPLYNLINIRAHLLLYIAHYGIQKLINDKEFHLH